jgi:hypothetical protein
MDESDESGDVFDERRAKRKRYQANFRAKFRQVSILRRDLDLVTACIDPRQKISKPAEVVDFLIQYFLDRELVTRQIEISQKKRSKHVTGGTCVFVEDKNVAAIKLRFLSLGYAPDDVTTELLSICANKILSDGLFGRPAEEGCDDDDNDNENLVGVRKW